MASQLDERHRTGGIGSLSTADALEALETSIAHGAPQIALLPIDWSVLVDQLPDGRLSPFLIEVTGGVPRRPASYAAAQTSIRTDLMAVSAAERRDRLASFSREQIARVLGLDDPGAIDPLQGLTDLGMDSLMAVELSNRLRAGLDLALPSTLVFEHPTLNDLVDHLVEMIFGRTNPDDTAEPTHDDELAALGCLTSDELTDALLRELDDAGY
jgi:acyl carrier protein